MLKDLLKTLKRKAENGKDEPDAKKIKKEIKEVCLVINCVIDNDAGRTIFYSDPSSSAPTSLLMLQFQGFFV